jgi:hypothetical protein
MVIKEQKNLEEKKVTGKIALVENSDPSCKPGCCDNSSNK